MVLSKLGIISLGYILKDTHLLKSRLILSSLPEYLFLVYLWSREWGSLLLTAWLVFYGCEHRIETRVSTGFPNTKFQ